MNIRSLACLPALIVVFAYSQQVEAEALPEYTSHVGVVSEYHNLHFVELSDEGESINEEKGSLFFTGAGFNWQFSSGVFSEVFFKQASDSLPYRGITQLGRLVTTETEYYISDLSMMIGRNFGATSAFIGVNNHYRERNVLGVENIGGIYEELDILNGVFGMRAHFFRNNRFQIRLEARVATGIDASLYYNDGDLDPIEISPGKQMFYRTSVELFYNPFSRLVVSLIPAYEYTSIDKSGEYMVYKNGSPVGLNSHLPATEWESYSLTGKLAWYF